MEKIEKMPRGAFKLPFKAGVWYTASSVITKGISMLTTPIFTRLMTETEYAVLPLYLSRIGIISAIGGAEALGTAMLVGLHKFEGKKDELTGSAIALEIGVIGIICILYFTFYYAFNRFGVESKVVSLAMFLQVLFDGITGLMLISKRYEYKYRTVFLTNVLSTAASAALGIFLTERLSIGGYERIVSLLFVSAVSTFLLLARHDVRGRIASGEMIKFLLLGALPLIPQGLGTALLAGIDRLMITRHFGAAALAKYSVAHSLGVAVCFISSALIMALRPWMLRKLRSYKEERIFDALNLCVPILAVLVIAVCCIAPEGMRVLAPVSYLDALPVIPPIALSVLPAFLSSVSATALVFHGKSVRAILPVGISVAVNVILNVLFFKMLPYTAAALSSLAASLTALAVWWALTRGALRVRIYSMGRFIICFAASAISAIVIYLLTDYIAVRMLILAAVIIIPFPLYKKAVLLVKE